MMSPDEVRRTWSTELCLRVGVRSERLLKALGEIARERFIGPGPWTLVGSGSGMQTKPRETPNADPIHVYDDVSVALDSSRNLYNGAPGVVIPWIDSLDLREGDRVFHVGGGLGYYTAILASIVGPQGRVLMAEVDQGLGNRARHLLSGFDNVAVFVRDGSIHDPGACDAILVNAGVTHPAPLWLSRLSDGGRLLLPLTFEFPNSSLGKGAALKIIRQHSGFAAAFLSGAQPVVIFSCSSVRDPALNQQLLTAYSTRIQMLAEIRSVRLDPHQANSTCWVHTDSMCLSTKLPCQPGLQPDL